MRGSPHRLLLATLQLLLASCTYSGAIEPGKVDLHTRLEQYQALPWTVSFDKDASTFDTIKGRIAGTSRDIVLKTAGLEDGVERAIKQIFRDPDPGEAADLKCEFDLLSLGSPGTSASCTLSIKFSHAASGAELRSYKKSIQLRDRSGAEGTEGFFIGLTLGLSSVASPAVTNALGTKARRDLESEVAIFLSEVYLAIEGDDRAAFRRGIQDGIARESTQPARRASSTPGIAESNPTPEFETPTPRSPFDLYMHAVFVVLADDGSLGSGFFVTPSGSDRVFAVTNAHVVNAFRQVTIKTKEGRIARVEVLHTDDGNDIAVLEVDWSPSAYLELADGSDVTIGNDVIAIGTPLGLEWSVSRGVLSQVRPRSNGSAFIQTDVSINPGNSGGPIIDPALGHVVGITSFRITDNDSGLNFGIHCSTIDAILRRME